MRDSHQQERSLQHRQGESVIVAAVITVSDRSAAGERADSSGPRAVELLAAAGLAASTSIVPDGVESVRAAIQTAIDSGARVVLTTGGTGLSARDLTPEGTRPLLQRELPGISELLRGEGAKHTPMAVLSRGLAGIAGRSEEAQTLVVNLPGSVKAVEQGLAVLLPLIPHILEQLDGRDH